VDASRTTASVQCPTITFEVTAGFEIKAMALLDPINERSENQKIALGVNGVRLVAALGYFLLLFGRSRPTGPAAARSRVSSPGRAGSGPGRWRPLGPGSGPAESLRKRPRGGTERLPTGRRCPASTADIGSRLPVRLGHGVFTPRTPEEKDIFFEFRSR